jgi:hypothetical protein
MMLAVDLTLIADSHCYMAPVTRAYRHLEYPSFFSCMLCYTYIIRRCWHSSLLCDFATPILLDFLLLAGPVSLAFVATVASSALALMNRIQHCATFLLFLLLTLMARLFCFRLLELHTACRSVATLHAFIADSTDSLLLALMARISSILLPPP